MRLQFINFLNSKQFDQWFHVHDIYCENKWDLFIFIVLSHNVSLIRKSKYFCHARNYVEYGVGWGMGCPNIPLSGKFKFIKYKSHSTDTCSGNGHKPTWKQSYTCITCSLIQPPPHPGGRGGFRSFQLRACLVHCQFFYDETLMSNEFKYVVADVMVIENAEHWPHRFHYTINQL